MTNFFKYVFVETKFSWSIGSSFHSLSFSLDGTTVAGRTLTKAANSSNYAYNQPAEYQVQFWETATGAATSLFKRSSFVVFSPTDPNMAVLVRSGSIHMLKRDSFGGKTWGGQYRHDSTPDAVCTFNSDGKTIAMSSNASATQAGNLIHEYDTTTLSRLPPLVSGSPSVNRITSVTCCPIKPGWFVVGDHKGELGVVSIVKHSLLSHCRLSPVEPASVSACAWSQDGKWIATGNVDGDTFLWNASVPISVSFAMQLPPNQPNTTSQSVVSRCISSLVFVPDSTALIIISGGYLSVWDIERVEYVVNSGLPDMAVNIALDGPRNRLAVAVNDKISIYELKLPEQKREMDGKSTIPSELAEFDVTDAVVSFDSEPFEGLYFDDVYRGAWKLDTPRIFEHVVAIKVLQPDDNAREQPGFEDVR